MLCDSLIGDYKEVIMSTQLYCEKRDVRYQEKGVIRNDGYSVICSDCHHSFVIDPQEIMAIKLGLRSCFNCGSTFTLVESSFSKVA